MMKNITLLVLLLLATSQSRAQSLSDLFKGLFGSGRTETVESKPESKPEGPKFPSASTLAGTWIYNEPIVEYTGGDVVAKMAVSALRGQAAELAAKVGLQSGRDKVRLTDRDRVTLEIGDKHLDASYEYAPATGTLELTLRSGARTATFRGTAEQTAEGALRLTFDATDCMRVIRTVAPEALENSYFKTLNAIVEQYPGLRCGCAFTRGR